MPAMRALIMRVLPETMGRDKKDGPVAPNYSNRTKSAKGTLSVDSEANRDDRTLVPLSDLGGKRPGTHSFHSLHSDDGSPAHTKGYSG